MINSIVSLDKYTCTFFFAAAFCFYRSVTSQKSIQIFNKLETKYAEVERPTYKN